MFTCSFKVHEGRLCFSHCWTISIWNGARSRCTINICWVGQMDRWTDWGIFLPIIPAPIPPWLQSPCCPSRGWSSCDSSSLELWQIDQKQPVPGQHLFPADFLLAMPLSWGNLSWAPFPWRSDHHISESSLWAQHMSTWYFARKTHREDCRLQYNTHSVIPSV